MPMPMAPLMHMPAIDLKRAAIRFDEERDLFILSNHFIAFFYFPPGRGILAMMSRNECKRPCLRPPKLYLGHGLNSLSSKTVIRGNFTECLAYRFRPYCLLPLASSTISHIFLCPGRSRLATDLNILLGPAWPSGLPDSGCLGALAHYGRLWDST